MIVVTGVDGSETAARAAAKAAALAAAFDGQLVVLSAFDTFESALPEGVGDVVRMTAADVAARLAEQTIGDLRAEHPALEMTARAVVGKPADALIEVADELGADVVVVGNKRVQGLARVLGSIARDVARRASCDVYVAHTHER
jgi:nucleotide-binding universal stress UspA family protein